jgi:hypothetical protein
MDFIQINNPVDDRNNCTIISFSVSAGIPYSEANEIGITAGREKNKGFYLKKLFSVARKKGISLKKIPVKKMVLSRFIEKYPNGRFVVERRGHAFSVINGKIYDTIKNGEKCFVLNCYKFENHRKNTIKKIMEKYR